MLPKSDKTAFVNITVGPRIRLVKLFCVGCVENVHHRQARIAAGVSFVLFETFTP